MKATLSFLFLLVVILGLVGYSLILRWNVNGSERILEAIRSIREGDSQSEVKKKFDREPSIAEADRLPAWLKEAVPERNEGEYWYYFMGYPPRNLIIYFDENKRVSYITWDPT
jgi:hypothetical protein